MMRKQGIVWLSFILLFFFPGSIKAAKIFLCSPPDFTWEELEHNSRIKLFKKPNSHVAYSDGVEVSTGEKASVFRVGAKYCELLLGQFFITIPFRHEAFTIKLDKHIFQTQEAVLGIEKKINGDIHIYLHNGKGRLKVLQGDGETRNYFIKPQLHYSFTRKGLHRVFQTKLLPATKILQEYFLAFRSLPLTKDEDDLAWEVEKSDFGIEKKEIILKKVNFYIMISLLKILSENTERLEILSRESKAIQDYMASYLQKKAEEQP
ncbi:hypothetical protein ACFL35_02810 [Candidatus Riflebacteria bacterium]